MFPNKVTDTLRQMSHRAGRAKLESGLDLTPRHKTQKDTVKGISFGDVFIDPSSPSEINLKIKTKKLNVKCSNLVNSFDLELLSLGKKSFYLQYFYLMGPWVRHSRKQNSGDNRYDNTKGRGK